MKQQTFRAVAGTAFIALMTLGLAACHAPAVKPSAPGGTPTEISVPGAVHYQVDSAASELHILVYRGGAMARMGHNHVISSKNVSGSLWVHPNLTRSRLLLTLPVNSLIVDDAAARQAEGEDFAVAVPQDARDGTRKNMLRPEVLDGEQYPNVTLQSTAISGTRASPLLTLHITIKNASHDVSVPVKLTETAEGLTASGQFDLKQTDFGITPFSIALGALKVVDAMHIKFSIICRQQK